MTQFHTSTCLLGSNLQPPTQPTTWNCATTWKCLNTTNYNDPCDMPTMVEYIWDGDGAEVLLPSYKLVMKAWLKEEAEQIHVEKPSPKSVEDVVASTY